MYLSYRNIQATQTRRTVPVFLVGTLLLGTGSAFSTERASNWRDYVQPRVNFSIVEKDEKPVDNLNKVDLRSPYEHIENIKDILNVSVSELASVCGVTRQSIYKWLSGSSSPEPENLEALISLSHVADAFDQSKVNRAEHMAKVKMFNGKSILDLVREKENIREEVAALIKEAMVMEASYEKSGLSQSSAKPNNNWQSYVSIPGSTERT